MLNVKIMTAGVLACTLAFGSARGGEFDLPRAEFAKYYREITGKEASDGIVQFAIDSKVSPSGRDAYVIKSGPSESGWRASVPANSGRASSPASVTITGSNLRSVWYGLYDLLERRGGCHWFWDGDVVPKKDSIDFSNLDIHEEARFEYRGLRYFAHRGLTRFQAEHWGPEDWKKEIDWILKRRLNVFMLRIGQDDLFQRTFPDACAYPDPSKSLPGAGTGYNDRSLFWSLQFRGKLRDDLQRYGFERGLMVPEDYGTMTHWYAPTPLDYIENRKPPFYPGTDTRPVNNRVWDVRDERWIDEYWKMTKTAVETYGKGAPEPRLLHTIGTGERILSKDKKENFKLKVLGLQRFMSRVERDYPDAKLLMPGWDFYYSWSPQEVRDFLKLLDPKKCIVWDYSADYRSARGAKSNFTKWDVIGKFPYTYSIFLAYENALDARADYSIIEERQKLVQDDPFCKGYVFWPESSHTDTLLLRFFTANAWSEKPISHGEVLDEFCASRYGEHAAVLKAAWKAALPASWLREWSGNYGRFMVGQGFDANASPGTIKKWSGPVTEAEAVFGLLARVPWQDEFIRRDAIDIARMVLDRVISLRTMELCRDIAAWRTGKTGVSPVETLPSRGEKIAALCDKMADLLALHTDYSLWETYQRMDAVEKIRNPEFSKTLFENASCPYCRSHQYELARHWYAARARQMAESLAKAVASGDRAAKLGCDAEQMRLALKAKPLESLRPTLPRTEANFRKVLREVQALCAPDMSPEWELVKACGFRIVLGDLSDPVIGHRKAIFSDSLAHEDRLEGTRLVRTWRGPHPLLGAEFRATATFDRQANGSFVCGFEYSGNASTQKVEKIAFPDIPFSRTDATRILVPEDLGHVVWPDWGKINPGQRVAGRIPQGFHFIAAFEPDGAGYYLDQRGDARAHATELCVYEGKDGCARLVSWYNPIIGEESTRAFRMPFPCLTTRFAGGWFGAAQVYRAWAKTQPYWKAAAARDRGKVGDVSMWFWNRGRSGHVIPPVERFTADAGVPAALDWYWWHEIPYDTDFPNFWPPREPEADFRAGVARCNEKNIFVQPYINGLSWDQDGADWNDGGAQGAFMRRDGKILGIAHNRFNNHRLAHMCGEAPVFQRRIRELVRTLRGCGFPSVYMDQVNASLGPCWNPAHRHGPGGGSHKVENFRAYISAVRTDNPGLLLSTEHGGEAYLEYFDFVITLDTNFERARRTYPRSYNVPCFQAVFHECLTTFGSFAMIDGIPAFDEKWPKGERWKQEEDWPKRFPDQFAVEVSRGPAWGLQPCVHNFRLENADDPRLVDDYRFMIETARFWHANRPWLLLGEMRDPGTLSCTTKIVDFLCRSSYTKEGEYNVSTEPALPTVFHSVWKASDGRVAATLCNWTREPQAYDLRAPDISAKGTIPPRSWKRLVP